MALDAGAVFTILGGRFNPGAFEQYDAANKRAIASATQAEAAMGSAARNGARAQDEMANATGRSARASEQAAKSHVRLRESLPLAAMNNWSKQSDQAGKNLSKLGSVAAKTAGIGLLAVGAGAVYAAAKATTFNREMLKLQTQAGASAAEVAKLKGQVLGLAGRVPQGPQQLAEGLYHLQSAGFRGAQSMELLEAAAKGAALGNSDLESTTQAMISVMASQIGGVHGAADAMGQLNNIVGVGDVRMEDLAKAMGTSGLLPVAAHFGLQLKDVGAMIATTTDNATPAAVTLTRLRMAISLLGASSPKATKELATIGIGSKQLAEDMRKPNGGLVAIEDLTKHLKDSGKSATEQAQLVSKAFGGGRSSAGITLLLDEIGRLQSKYHQLGQENGPQKLAQSWEAFQHSQSASFGELKSAAEGFAITVGNVVLPSLTRLAHEGASSLQHFVSSGDAAHLGTELQHTFETIVHAASDLAPVLLAAAHGLIAVGQAVGLGNASELAALAAAFLAFRGITFVAPMLLAIGGAIAEVGAAAYTAASVDAFAADILAMASPVGWIIGALTVAAGLFVLLSGHEKTEADAAKEVTAAKEAEASAISAANDAILGAANATFGARKADNELAKSKEHLADVAKQYGKHSSEYRAALNEEREAALRDTGEHDQLAKAKEKMAEADKKAQKAAAERVKTSREAVATFMGEKGIGGTPGLTGARMEDFTGPHPRAEYEKFIALTKDYLVALKQQGGAGTTSQIQLSRVLAGQPLLLEKSTAAVAHLNTIWGQLNKTQQQKLAATPENQLAEIGNLVGQLHGVPTKQKVSIIVDAHSASAQIAALQAVLHGVPPSKVIQILTTAHGAALQVAALQAVLHGVPPGKVIHILHNAPSAKAAMEGLTRAVHEVPPSKSVNISANVGAALAGVHGVTNAIGELHDKTVNVGITRTEVTVGVKKHASGRGTGAGEAALVGEGGGPEYVIDSKTGGMVVVNQPTIMGLSPEDYVIPTEDRYRGRALGLMAMLAREWGMPGFKGGKGKGKHHYTIPDAINPLSLPLGEIEQKQSHAKQASSEAATKVKDLTTKVHEATPTGSASHKKLKKLKEDLAHARRQAATDRRDLEEWNRTTREAKAYDAKIKRTEKDAENARAQMKLAADHDDPAAYGAAKGRRLGALHHLQELLKAAGAVISRLHPGSQGALDREGELLAAQEDLLGAEREDLEPGRSKAAEEEERSGQTEAERAEQARIKKNIALAALTPSLADDKAAAQELVGFLERVLGETQAEPEARGGDEGIAATAEALKSARSNLESLAGGSASNENADVQAQIEQAKARAEAAEATVRVQEGALAVLGGPGDIGAGGVNARGAAAGITQNIYTLHPADPATLTAIGAAATAGIDYQGGRQATRINVGP